MHGDKHRSAEWLDASFPRTFALSRAGSLCGANAPSEGEAGGRTAGWLAGRKLHMRFCRQGTAKTKKRRLERPWPFFSGRAPRKSVWSNKVRMYRSGAHRGPGVFPLGQKGGRDRAWVMHIVRVQLCPVQSVAAAALPKGTRHSFLAPRHHHRRLIGQLPKGNSPAQ
jgi:hypothetical protein